MGSTACYAEYGMFATSQVGEWQTCVFAPSGCEFEQGSAAGSASEAFVGTAVGAYACANLVVATEPTASGASYRIADAGPSKACFAVFGLVSELNAADTSRVTCTLGD